MDQPDSAIVTVCARRFAPLTHKPRQSRRTGYPNVRIIEYITWRKGGRKRHAYSLCRGTLFE